MNSQSIQVSAFQEPKDGNTYCGDSFYYNETADQFICVLADGLGSGKYALESSQAVIDIIKENNNISVREFVRESNKILFGKRGVVVGILKIDFKSQSYSFSSIGNIGIMTITDGDVRKRNIPSSGYLAGYERPIKVVSHSLKEGTTFIMFSDGVKDRDLSHGVFLDKDVKKITNSYKHSTAGRREDDTTLIAMRYK